MPRPSIIVTTAFVLIVVAVSWLVGTQSYPALMVGWRPIAYGEFRTAYNSALTYYGKALQTYDRSSSRVLDSSETKQDIKRAIIDKIIEDRLVEADLRRRMSAEEISNVVRRKISEATSGAEIANEVRTLYGLTLDEFGDYILEPQAEREILEGRLILEGKNFTDWLREARSAARITILLPGFEWDGGEVISK